MLATTGFAGGRQATMLIAFFLLDWFYGGLFETF